MKKIIIIVLLAAAFINMNACGGSYFDDGSRAFRLTRLVGAGDVSKAQTFLESNNVSTQMRFKCNNNASKYKSMVGLVLELGWLERQRKKTSYDAVNASFKKA